NRRPSLRCRRRWRCRSTLGERASPTNHGQAQCQPSRYRRKSLREDLHSAPPGFFAALPSLEVGGTYSIRALVRLLSTNVLFATRRISAFVTASTFFNWLNSSRQSPKRVWYSAS